MTGSHRATLLALSSASSWTEHDKAATQKANVTIERNRMSCELRLRWRKSEPVILLPRHQFFTLTRIGIGVRDILNVTVVIGDVRPACCPTRLQYTQTRSLK